MATQVRLGLAHTLVLAAATLLTPSLAAAAEALPDRINYPKYKKDWEEEKQKLKDMTDAAEQAHSHWQSAKSARESLQRERASKEHQAKSNRDSAAHKERTSNEKRALKSSKEKEHEHNIKSTQDPVGINKLRELIDLKLREEAVQKESIETQKDVLVRARHDYREANAAYVEKVKIRQNIERTISDLNQDVTNAKRQAIAAQRDVDRAAQTNEALALEKKNVNDAKQLITDIGTQITALQEALDHNERSLDDSIRDETRMAEAVEKAEASLKAAEEEISHAKVFEEALFDQQAEARAEISNLRDFRDATMRKAREVREELRYEETGLARLKQRLSDAEKNTKTLVEEIRQHEEAEPALRRALEDANTALAALGDAREIARTRDKAKRRVAEVQAALADNRAELAVLTDRSRDIAELRTAQPGLKKALAAAERELADLGDPGEADAARIAAQATLDAAKAALKANSDALANVSDQTHIIADLNNTISTQKRALAEATAALDALGMSRSTDDAARQAAQAKVDQVQNAVDKNKKALEATPNQMVKIKKLKREQPGLKIALQLATIAFNAVKDKPEDDPRRIAVATALAGAEQAVADNDTMIIQAKNLQTKHEELKAEAERLAETLHQARLALADLTSNADEVKAAQEQVEHAQAALGASQEKLATATAIQADYNELTAATPMLERAVAAAKRDRDDLGDRQEEMADRRQARERVEVAQAALTANVIKLTEAETMQQRYQTLRAELAGREKELAKALRVLADLGDEEQERHQRIAIEAKVAEAQKNLAANTDHLDEVRHDYDATVKSVSRQKIELHAQHLIVEGINTALRNYDDFDKKYRQAERLQEDAINAAENKKREARKRIEDAKNGLLSAEQTLTSLSHELAATQMTVEGYKQQISTINSEIENQKNKAMRIYSDLGENSRRVESLAQAIDVLVKRLQHISSKVSDNSRIIEEQKRIYSAKTRAAHELEQEIRTKWSPSLTTAKATEETAKTTNDQRLAAKNAEEGELDRLEKGLASMVRQRQGWQTEENALKQANLILTAAIKELEDEAQTLDEEAIQLRRDATTLDKEVGELAAKIPGAQRSEDSKKAIFEARFAEQTVQEQTSADAQTAYEQRLTLYNTERTAVIATAKAAATELGSADGAKDGASAGKAAGEAEGVRDGNTDGIRLGKAREYKAGAALGRIEGEKQGKIDGKLAGERIGAVNGKEDGAMAGKHDGYAEGRSAGYDAVYQDSYNSALAIKEYYERGYEDGIPLGLQDASNQARQEEFPRGYQAARDATIDLNRDFEVVVIDNEAQDHEPSEENISFGAMHPRSNDGSVDKFVLVSLNAPQKNYCTDNDPGSPISPRVAYQKPINTDHLDYAGFKELYIKTFGSQYTSTYASTWVLAYKDGFVSGYPESCATTYKKVFEVRYQASYDAGQQDGYDAVYESWKQKWTKRYSAPEGEFATAYKAAYNVAYKSAYDAEYPVGDTKGRIDGKMEGLADGEAKAVEDGTVAGRADGKKRNMSEQRQIWFAKGERAFADELSNKAWPAAIGVEVVNTAGESIETADKLWSGTKVSLQVTVRNFGGKPAQPGELTVKVENVNRASGSPKNPVSLKELAPHTDSKYINVADLYVVGGHQSTDDNEEAYGVFHVIVTVMNGGETLGQFEVKRRVDESFYLSGKQNYDFVTGSIVYGQRRYGEHNQGHIRFANASPYNFNDLTMKIDTIKTKTENGWKKEDGWIVTNRQLNQTFKIGDMMSKSYMRNRAFFHTYHDRRNKPTDGKKIYYFNIYDNAGHLIHSQTWYIDIDRFYN